MRPFSTALAALFAIFTIPNVSAKTPLEYEYEFAAWMKDHHITFHDAMEYVHRFENYIANDLLILTHNMEKKWGFTLGHNQFSHMTYDEFKQHALGLNIPPGYLKQRLSQNTTHLWTTTTNVPDEIDWVAKGAVTSVKNQGQCGSCWAFSTTGAVEGATFVSSGQLPNLSEQELVDCDDNGDMGCNGGLMDHAFDWIENHNGLCAEEDYAYEAKKGVCRTCKEVVKVTGYQDVQPNNEQALKVAVAQQPVSVAIEADQREFQFYKTGVFDKPCGTQLDHGVLVVGYGVDQGQKFWKIKNSWSSTWGESGYIRISREVANSQGQCGVAMAPSYPFASIISNAKHLRSVDTHINKKVEANLMITEDTLPIKSSAKISQCGDTSKAGIVFDTLSIMPQAPKRGHPITFTGNGATKAEIDSAAFQLTVRLAGEHVFGHNGKLCGETHIPLPLGLGHIDVHGLQCPLKQGAQSGLKVDVRLPAIAPAGNYQIELLAGNGASKDSLFCVDVKLDLNDADKELTSQKANVYEFMAEM